MAGHDLRLLSGRVRAAGVTLFLVSGFFLLRSIWLIPENNGALSSGSELALSSSRSSATIRGRILSERLEAGELLMSFQAPNMHRTGGLLKLILKNNHTFLDKGFSIQYDGAQPPRNSSTRYADCFFTGSVRDFPSSQVTLMNCDGVLVGDISLSPTLHYKFSSHASEPNQVEFTRQEEVSELNPHLFRRAEPFGSVVTRNFVSPRRSKRNYNGNKVLPVKYLRIKLGVEKDIVEAEGSFKVVSQIMQYTKRIADFFGPNGMDVGAFRVKPLFKRVYVFNVSPFSQATGARDYLREWCSRMGPRRRLRERVEQAGVLRENMGYRNAEGDSQTLKSQFEDDYNQDDAVDVSMMIKANPLQYSQPISGLSYVNTTCSTMACGVIFTLGKILAQDSIVDNVGVFGHELMHTLGAWNDGQVEMGNNCEQGYLMGGARNKQLSECTMRELRQSLQVKNTRCLRSEMDLRSEIGRRMDEPLSLGSYDLAENMDGAEQLNF